MFIFAMVAANEVFPNVLSISSEVFNIFLIIRIEKCCKVFNQIHLEFIICHNKVITINSWTVEMLSTQELQFGFYPISGTWHCPLSYVWFNVQIKKDWYFAKPLWKESTRLYYIMWSYYTIG